jgi:hypothetical protein
LDNHAILGHGFEVLAARLLPRAHVETTAGTCGAEGEVKETRRGGVKGRRRISGGRVWVKATYVRGGRGKTGSW